MALVHAELSAYELEAQLSFAEYSSDKIADIDFFRNADMIDKFMNAHSMKRIARYGETLNARVLARFIAEASPENQGTSAGMISHGYNLGTSAVPVDLSNPDNIATFLARIQTVLVETKCFTPNSGWHLVVPQQFANALYSSAFANKLSLGACSEIVCQGVNGGGVNGSAGLFGMRLWQNLGLGVPNAAGAVPLVFFHESAQLFCSDMVVSRVYENVDFEKLYQQLWVSGGKVIYPHLCGVAWVSFG